jgi:D-alanine-D-alanine ligase
MRKKISIAIIYNEPVTGGEVERKFVSADGVLEAVGKSGGPAVAALVDMSEVGVLEEREDIARALQAAGYKAAVLNVDGDLNRLIGFLKEEQPDLIFNLCESVGNVAIHEMHIAGIYELLGVPYTGSDAITLGTALNKVRVKEILAFNGLPTPRFQLFKSAVKIAVDESMQFPLIVKPSREDASIGIETRSVVSSLAELRKRVRYIIEEYDQPALVEEYIDGRELNVAILGNRKPLVFPISEIDMSTLPAQYPRIVTYNAKWMKGTDEFEHTRGVCPALLPAELETEIKSLALRAYGLLGCRDYARVDFRLSKDHQPFILEVNPNPDISDDAGFARSAGAYGYSFDQLVGKIVECALERMP